MQEARDSEEARAERRRRQRQAQEDFRLKQLQKNQIQDQELNKGSSIDSLLMAIPTQDIIPEESGKRRSPPPEGSAKRHAGGSKTDADE